MNGAVVLLGLLAFLTLAGTVENVAGLLSLSLDPLALVALALLLLESRNLLLRKRPAADKRVAAVDSVAAEQWIVPALTLMTAFVGFSALWTAFADLSALWTVPESLQPPGEGRWPLSFFMLQFTLMVFALLAVVASILRAGRAAFPWIGESMAFAEDGWLKFLDLFSGPRDGARSRGTSDEARTGNPDGPEVPASQAGARRLEEMRYPVSPTFWSIEMAARAATFLFFLFICLRVVQYTWLLGQFDGNQFTVLAQRIQDVGMGLSPAWFMLLGSAVVVAWAVWHVLRVWQLLEYTPFDDAAMSDGRARPESTEEPGLDPGGDVPGGWTDAWADTLAGIRNVRWRLLLLVPDTRALGFLLFIGGMTWWIWGQFRPTIELVSSPEGSMTGAWAWLLPAYVLTALAVTSWSIYRLYAVWEALKQALYGIEQTPLVFAFDRLPRRLARMARLTVLSFGGRKILNRVGDSQLNQMKRLQAGLEQSELEALCASSALRERVFESDFAKRFEVEGRSTEDGDAIHDLWQVLMSRWTQEPAEDCIEELRDRLAGDPTKVASVETRQTLRSRTGLWIRTAEEFLATQFVGYIDWALRQMKMLALFILTMILLSTFLFTAYPFVPQSTVNMSLLVLVGVAVAVFMTILVQLSRDEILSRMTGTEPGEVNVNRTFVSNILIFAALPIVAVLTSKFPGLRETLFAWLGPLGQAFGTF
jgi:hypothetical protein